MQASCVNWYMNYYCSELKSNKYKNILLADNKVQACKGHVYTAKSCYWWIGSYPRLLIPWVIFANSQSVMTKPVETDMKLNLLERSNIDFIKWVIYPMKLLIIGFRTHPP